MMGRGFNRPIIQWGGENTLVQYKVALTIPDGRTFHYERSLPLYCVAFLCVSHSYPRLIVFGS